MSRNDKLARRRWERTNSPKAARCGSHGVSGLVGSLTRPLLPRRTSDTRHQDLGEVALDAWLAADCVPAVAARVAGSMASNTLLAKSRLALKTRSVKLNEVSSSSLGLAGSAKTSSGSLAKVVSTVSAQVRTTSTTAFWLV